MASAPYVQAPEHHSEISENAALPMITLKLPARRSLMWLLIITFALVSLSLITHLIFINFDMAVDNSSLGFMDRFSVDHEQSFPTYFSAGILMLAAVVSHQIARLTSGSDKITRRYWWALALVFAVMSLEEIVGFHEGLGAVLRRTQPDAGQGLTWNQWIFVGIPLVIVTALVFLPFVRSLPTQTRNLLYLAGALYVGGAIGMEMMEGVARNDNDPAQVGVMVVRHLEELLEKSGVVTLIYALLSHLQRIQTQIV